SVQRVRNLDPQLQHRFHFHRPPGNVVLQSQAIKELHRDESSALVFADIVYGADARMVQRRGSARLAAEAFQDRTVPADLFGNEFQGHQASQSRVLGLVDHSHPTRTESFQDAIVRNRSRGKVHTLMESSLQNSGVLLKRWLIQKTWRPVVGL